MSLWTAIVVIVAIIAVAEVLKAKHRAQHGITKDWLGNELNGDEPGRLPPVRDEQLEREVKDLRERVKVLERIATEDRETKRLSAEIESLRKE